jgi:hypothetical protein
VKRSTYKALQVTRILSASAALAIGVSIWIQPSLPNPWGLVRFIAFFFLGTPGAIAAWLLHDVKRKELTNG